MEKRKQAPSKDVGCDICGKVVKARGLHGHRRLGHQVSYKIMESEKPVPDSTEPTLENRAMELQEFFKFSKAFENQHTVRLQRNGLEWKKFWLSNFHSIEEEWDIVRRTDNQFIASAMKIVINIKTFQAITKYVQPGHSPQ